MQLAIIVTVYIYIYKLPVKIIGNFIGINTVFVDIRLTNI